jgi:hypothetical protein
MSNPIEALINDDPSGFRDSVSNILMQKLANRFESERIDVASNMFGSVAAQSEEE